MDEQRRFLGFPVGGSRPGNGPLSPAAWLGGPVDRRWLAGLLHPVRALRAWRRHRRLGPYDVGDGS